jgi:hypothetical protein
MNKSNSKRLTKGHVDHIATSEKRIRCVLCNKAFSKDSTFDKLHSKECVSTEFTPVNNCIDVLDELLKFHKKEIKEEDSNVLKTILYGISAFTNNPINNRLIAPSGEGKTYLVNKVSATFPEQSLIILSSASAQSFKYSHGQEVIEEENGKFTPIWEKINPLEERLANAKGKEKKDIEKQIEQLHKESWYLIDFRNKWLIFLDSQNMSLWESLKTLLSHDSEKQRHQVTNKINGRNTQERMIFLGSPAVTYCSAKDESNQSIAPEMDTRFDTIFLQSNHIKYEKSIELISKRHGLPTEIFEEEVVSKQDLEYAKELTQILIENVKRYSSNKNPIVNPYSDKLAILFPHDSGSRSRQYSRLVQMITVITLCNANKRHKVVIGNNVYPIVELDDIKKAVSLMKENSVLPTQKIQFFNDVFKLVFVKTATDISLVDQTVKAVTANEMAEGIRKQFKVHKNIDRKKLTETYFDTWVDHGLLESARDPRNNSRFIYWIAKQYENQKVGLESSLIDTSSLDRSCLESFVNKYLKRRFESGKLRLIDENDHDVTLDMLIQNISLDKGTQNVTQPTQNRHKNTSGETTISDDLK